MNVLVTGGNGFLGRHLCRALKAEGHDVVCLDRNQNPECRSIVGDVYDATVVSQALQGVEAVFHLASLIEAGESVKRPYDYAQNNVMGAIVLLEEMRKRQIQTFIFSSSAAVYGEPVRVPILEDDRTIPINPYGMTKIALEALASSYSYSHGFTCVALRYFNLYGPGENHDPETHAIPRFIDQIVRGEEVTVWGNGEHQRDFVYVGDIVSAHVKSLQLEKGKYHYLNVSGKNATSVADVIAMIENILGKKATITKFPARAGDPLLLYADSSKAKTVLGWEAQTSLQEGLEKTIKERLLRVHGITL